MKKRLISLLLALVMIVTLCPMSVFADDDAAATDNGEETVVVTQEPESEPEPAEEPAEKEPAEEPSEEPAGEEPSEEPAGEEPSEEPAGEEPSEEPAGEEPSEEPEGEDPVNGDDPAEGDDPENGEDPTEGEDPAEDPEEPEPEEPAEEADPSDEGTFCGAHAHTHSAACYDENGALICGKEEHTHTLACYSDPNADVEDERDWKKSVSSAVLTGEWAHDLIEVAKTQLGYQESEKNYIVTEDGQKKGYTRYGAWAGKATVYADWCAGFVAFCAYYAKVEIPTSFGCMLFAEKLQGAGLYRSADGYEPKAGDIIFFGEKNGSVPNHTGIVVSVSDTQIRTIEGNHTNKVASFTYDRNDASILGFGELPENPDYVAPEEPGEQPEEPEVNETVSVSVTAAFENDGDASDARPESVSVQLYKDGEPEGKPVVLNAENEWTYAWTGLPMGECTLTAEEVEGYTLVLTGDAQEGFVLTYTYGLAEEPEAGEPVQEEISDEAGLMADMDMLPEDMQMITMRALRTVATRPIAVTINWSGDLPTGYDYPSAVFVTMERSTDGTDWEPYEEGGPFPVERANSWNATFNVPAATEPEEPEQPQSYYYRVTEDPAGLGRFSRTDPVIVAPGDSGAVSFTNTYNDEWDYTVDLYWLRGNAEERYHINTETIDGDGLTDVVVYQMDVHTQKTYEGISTDVSDYDLLHSTTGLVIRVPLHFFQDRGGNWVDPSNYAIGNDQAPSLERDFTYRIIGDEIVFYNRNTLSGTYTGSWTVEYRVDPENTLDGSSATLYADAVGHYVGQPADDDGHQRTPDITYHIDTGAVLTHFSKDSGVSLYDAYGDLADMTMHPDYYYVNYIVRVQMDGNQPSTVTITDTPKYYTQNGQLAVGGEVVRIIKWKYRYNHKTAPAGHYPEGDPSDANYNPNVPFTHVEGTANTVQWTTTYDAVWANANLHSGANGYWTMMEAMAEQDFFVIVRYPKSTYFDPATAGAPNYQNYVTAQLSGNDPQHEGEVRDDPQHGIEGDDKNDLYFMDDVADAVYVPREDGWHWDGPTHYVYKNDNNNSNTFGSASGPAWLFYGGNPVGSYVVRFTGNGYNVTNQGYGYSMTVWDDDFYARPKIKSEDGTSFVYGNYVKLGPGDYEITTGRGAITTKIMITMWRANRDTGMHEMQAAWLPEEPFKFYGEKADGSWEEIGSFTMTEDNTTIATDNSGYYAQYSYPLNTSMFSGKGYIGFKIESPEGLVDHVEIYIMFGIKLLGTSPVAAAWVEQYGENLVSAQVINFATFRFYTENDEGDYVWTNPQTGPTGGGSPTYSGSPTGLAESEKTEDDQYEQYAAQYDELNATGWRMTQQKQNSQEVNDTAHFVYRVRWMLSINQYHPSQVGITDEIRDYLLDEAYFYDLLPEGYSIDRTRPIEVKGTGALNVKPAALDGEPIVIDNYKGTGRQLIIFKVKSLLEPGQNSRYANSQVDTGFYLWFWSQVPYESIAEGTVYNIAAFQRADRQTNSSAFPASQGYGSSSSNFDVNGEYPLANVELEVFDTPSEGKTTAYMVKGVSPSTLPSIQAGLKKYVKGVSGMWTVEDVTDVDANYAYRLRLQTAGSPIPGVTYYTGNIIIYDTLENAANTGGNTGEIDGWKGTLVSVDASGALALGAAPVVYYSTKTGISYNDNGSTTEWNDGLVNNPSIWTRADQYTGDMAAVTAIAVDLRYQANGDPFVIEDEKFINIVVNMHSPGAVPESQWAYNRPAHETTTWTDLTVGEPVPGFLIGSRTQIALRDLQDVEFLKYYTAFDPATGQVAQNPLAGATFALYQCIDPEGNYTGAGLPGTSGAASCWSTTPISSIVTSTNGMVRFTGLDTGIYAIVETAVAPVPTSIQRLANRFWVFSVDAVAGTVSDIVGYSTNDSSYPPVQMTQGTNYLMLEDPVYTIEITVLKVWDDQDDIDGIRPDSVQVQLKQNDSAYGPVVTLNSANNWTYTWQSLPKYSAYTSATNNTPYAYTVEEVQVPDDYELVITGDAAVGFTLTNKHTPETIDIPVEKVWASASTLQPTSVTVQLYKQIGSGEKTAEGAPVTLNAGNNWKYTWEDLPKHGKDGDDVVEITYSVEEEPIPAGYTVVVTGDMTGYTITNTPHETEITVLKVWASESDTQPDEIQVQLYQTIGDGEETAYGDPVTLSESNSWTYTWEHLPAKQGEDDITYRVDEVAIPTGYTKEVTSSGTTYTIKNTPEKINIPVEKVWASASTLQPDSVTVQLYKTIGSGEKTAEGAPVTLNAANNWKHTWENLPKYGKDGSDVVEIVYSVEEEPVPIGYTVDVSGSAADGFTVTNTPHETEITVLKVWANESDTQPNEIKVQLYQKIGSGEETALGEAVTLNEGNSWTYTWSHLPAKQGEDDITYRVDEVEIPTGYTKEVTSSGTTYTITNTPETINIPVEKVWASESELQPESVTVQLYKQIGSGEKTAEGEPVALNAGNSWKYTWENLPKYGKDGDDVVQITYTVEEEPIPVGYTVEVTGDMTGYTITNTPHETEVTVIKVWKDNDDKKEKRPENIQVQLYQTIGDGEETAYGEPVTLSEETGWTYTWEHLPAKQGEAEITYRVDEVSVPKGYVKDVTSEGTTYTITNTLPETPGTGDNTNIKLWLAMTLTSAAGLGGMMWLAFRKKKREQN